MSLDFAERRCEIYGGSHSDGFKYYEIDLNASGRIRRGTPQACAHLLEYGRVLLLEASCALLLIASEATGDAAALAEERAVHGHHLVPLGPHEGQLLRLTHRIAEQRIPAQGNYPLDRSYVYRPVF